MPHLKAYVIECMFKINFRCSNRPYQTNTCCAMTNFFLYFLRNISFLRKNEKIEKGVSQQVLSGVAVPTALGHQTAVRDPAVTAESAPRRSGWMFCFFFFSIMSVSTSTRAIRRNTLVVATRRDAASVNICNSLLIKAGYFASLGVEGHEANLYVCQRRGGGKVILWNQDDSLLGLDDPQDKVSSILGESIDDVIFLSKHTASSGRASLTVHPIGVPWLQVGSESEWGGKAGRCSPPHPLIAPLFRACVSAVKERGLKSIFQVSLEATHHGPFVKVPACFVEIGSTEDHWHIPQAGDLWADVLVDHLALIHSTEREIPAPPPPPPTPPQLSKRNVVLVTCGGGHYCPKLNDFCGLGDRAFSGHCMASYAIEPLLSSSEYQTVLDEVVTSTAQAHQDAEIWLLVDLKNQEQTLKVCGYMATTSPGVRLFTDFRQVKNTFLDK